MAAYLEHSFFNIYFRSGSNKTPFHPHVSTEEEVILNFGSNRGSSFEKIRPTEKTPTRTYRSCKEVQTSLVARWPSATARSTATGTPGLPARDREHSFVA